MLRKFIKFLKGVIEKMLGYKDIEKVVEADIAITDIMAENISLWRDMYENTPYWRDDSENHTVRVMGIPALIAAEVSRMVALEAKVELTGSARADYISEQIKPLIDKLRQYVEYGCALGGIVFKPYVSGKNVEIDIVQADSFFPIAFNARGEVTEAAFVEEKTVGEKVYRRVEVHKLSGSTYTVYNKAYTGNVYSRYTGDSSIGKEISLDSVPEWENIEPETVIQNVEKPFFSYFKPATVNVIDTHTPLGASVYSRAVDLIKDADIQYSRLIWEMQATEAAIDADISTVEFGALPELQKRLFRKTSVNGLYEPYLPNIRETSQINALNSILMRIEDVVGMSRGTISNPDYVAKTATELKMLKQRTYATVAENQKALETALTDLIYAIDKVAELYKLSPSGKYELSFEWDDSTITDVEQEYARRSQLVASGLLKPEKFIAWYFNCSEQAAIDEYMPLKTDLIDGDD